MHASKPLSFAPPTPKASAVERNPWPLLADVPPFPPEPPPFAGGAASPEPVLPPAPEPVLPPGELVLSEPDAERAWYGQAGVFEVQEDRDPNDTEILDAESVTRDVEFDPPFEAWGEGTGLQSSRDEEYQEELEPAASWSVVSQVEGSGQKLSSTQRAKLGDLVLHTGARVVDPVAHLKLPWEQGLYKSLFEPDPLATSLSMYPSPVQDSRVTSEDASSEKPMRAKTAAKSLRVFKQHLDVAYEDRVAKLAEVSLGKLVAFVDALPDSCKPVSWPTVYEECVEYLQACVGVKSPLTIEKRANSLLQYLRWAAKEGVCANLFTEEIFWSYVQSLKRTLAPASRGPAVASALRFAAHVLGVACPRTVLSRRCLGLLEQMEAAKGPVKQASPLSVEDLLVLHGMLKAEERAAWDRAAAAYLLVCAYGRARAGDFSRVDSIMIDLEGDEGFVEVLLKTHKGAKKSKLKNQLVPVLIPATGVDGSPWVSLAMSAFEAVGLSLKGHIGGALFRPPTSHEGAPGRREVRSAEVSELLRSFLGESGPQRCISSHSLKATCLSWASKYGVTPECQNVLGRHSDSIRGSAPLYSRDLCAAPVRQLQQIIRAIHESRFFPDSSRSLYFPKERMRAVVIEIKDELAEVDSPRSVAGERPNEHPPEPVCEEPPRDAESSGGSSPESSLDSAESSSSAESTSGSESEDCQAPPKRVARPSWPAKDLWMHRKSKVVHVAKAHTGAGTAIFACGRVVTRHHARADGSGQGRRCEACVRLFDGKTCV